MSDLTQSQIDADMERYGHVAAWRETSLPSNGKTFRLVTETNGTVNASCGLLTPSEAADMLGVEVTLHRLSGWRVSVSEGRVECERGTSRRVVRIEAVS